MGHCRELRGIDLSFPDNIVTDPTPAIDESVRHLYGPNPASINWGEDELVVLCLVRDGVRYIKAFLDHYDSLGVKHFVFLDNGSTDGTVETLAAESKERSLSVFLTELPYKDYRHEFKRYMIYRFGRRDRWVLIVDMDEFFDYPRSRAVNLGDFLGRLRRRGYTTVVSQMLDMFPAEPLVRDASPPRDENFREVHRYYDTSDIKTASYSDHPWIIDNEVSNEGIMAFRGGIRKRIFGVTATLTKHPLVFLDECIRPLEDSAHWTNGASVGDVSCVLYHYKFLEGFHEFAEWAAREESYADSSSEYKSYLKVLRKEPELRLHRETATELRGTDQLTASGFLVTSAHYDDWADELESSKVMKLAHSSPRELAGEFLRLRKETNVGARAAGDLNRRMHELGLYALRELEKAEARSKQREIRTPSLKSCCIERVARLFDRLKFRLGIGKRG